MKTCSKLLCVKIIGYRMGTSIAKRDSLLPDREASVLVTFFRVLFKYLCISQYIILIII